LADFKAVGVVLGGSALSSVGEGAVVTDFELIGSNVAFTDVGLSAVISAAEAFALCFSAE